MLRSALDLPWVPEHTGECARIDFRFQGTQSDLPLFSI